MNPVKTEWMTKQLNHPETKAYMQSIYNLAKRLNPGTALEIGCMWAVSTLAILLGSKAPLTSVDKSEYTHAPEELEANNLLDRWRFINMDSKDFWEYNDKTYDFIYVDGDHTYDYAKLDISSAAKILEPGGTLAIDDALHKWNKTGKYGVAVAALEELQAGFKDVGFEGNILWLKK